MTITLTLNPEEVAGIIHARAGNLCHAVTYPNTESEEESVPELINSLREAVDALEAARIDKPEGRELSRDAAEAVGALEELVEAVKTLYGLNDDEDEEPADCVK